MRAAAVFLASLTLALGCDKKPADKPAPPAPAPVTAGAVGTDGVRRIPVTASRDGYKPSEITAKPNEKLIMVLTRTVDGDCLSKIRVGDGPEIALPMNAPVDIPVTMPATGKVTFVCGMDMFEGTIAVAGT